MASRGGRSEIALPICSQAAAAILQGSSVDVEDGAMGVKLKHTLPLSAANADQSYSCLSILCHAILFQIEFASILMMERLICVLLASVSRSVRL